MVLIVDHSLSLARTGLFEHIKNRAYSVLNLVQDGDETAIVWTVNPAETASQFHHHSEVLNKKIQDQQTSYSRGAINKGLQQALFLLKQSHNLNEEVYFISDLQASEFSDPLDTTFYKDWNSTLFILPVQGETDNVGIDQAGIENQILQPQAPVRIFADIHNYGNQEIHDFLVRVLIDNQGTTQRVIHLKPGEKQRLVFPIRLIQTGWIRCQIQIDEDAFLPDNDKYFTFRVPETIRVLLIGKDMESIRPVELALNPKKESRNLFQIKRALHGQSWMDEINRADVVLMSNYPLFQSEEYQRLNQFVESGGGIFMFLGQDVDTSNYNRLWLEPLAGLHFNRIVGNQTGSQGYSSLRSLDPDHPLFEGVFKPDMATFQPLHFYRFIHLTGKAPQSILTFPDGKCLLAELHHGKGKIFLFTSSLDPEWSDIIYSSLFAPLMYRSVLYLSNWSGEEKDVSIGQTLSVSVDSGNIQSTYCIQMPGGNESFIIPEIRQNRYELSFSGTSLPGFYRFLKDQELIGVKAVNIDSRESDFKAIDKRALKTYFKHIGFEIVNKNDQLEQTVATTRWGRELWKEMLMLGIVVLVIEMLLMQEGRFRKKRKKVD